jgi:hypothetical protein
MRRWILGLTVAGLLLLLPFHGPLLEQIRFHLELGHHYRPRASKALASEFKGKYAGVWYPVAVTYRTSWWPIVRAILGAGALGAGVALTALKATRRRSPSPDGDELAAERGPTR